MLAKVTALLIRLKVLKLLQEQKELNLHPQVVSVLQEELVLLPVLELLTVFSKMTKRKTKNLPRLIKKKPNPQVVLAKEVARLVMVRLTSAKSS